MPYTLLAAVILSLGLSHYYPYWRAWFGGKEITHPTRLQSNYVVGILCIFVPFTIWLMSQGYGPAAFMMWIFIVVGGATVFFLYQHDANITNRQKLSDQKKINEQLEKLQDAQSKRPR